METKNRITCAGALRAFVALLAIAAAAACGGGTEWRDLTVGDAGFAVLMRGDPHYTKQELDTPRGRMVAHLYSSDRRDSYFAVGYADYPLALVVGSPPEQVFGGVRDTWVRRVSGRLVSSDNSIKLDGKYPGLEFTAEGRMKDADTFVQARLFLVDQRLYQLVAMGRKEDVPQGVINRFLNSFRLVPVTGVDTLRIEPGGKDEPAKRPR
jgi:hypothetical protein